MLQQLSCWSASESDDYPGCSSTYLRCSSGPVVCLSVFMLGQFNRETKSWNADSMFLSDVFGFWHKQCIYIYTHGFGRGNTVRAWIQFSVLKGHCPGQFAYSEDTRSSAAIMAAIVQRLVEFLKTSKANTARSEQPASLFSSQFGCLWARLHSKLFFHRQLGRLFMALAL